MILAMTNATRKSGMKDWARFKERRLLVGARVNQEVFMADGSGAKCGKLGRVLTCREKARQCP